MRERQFTMQPHERMLNNKTFKAFGGESEATIGGKGSLRNERANAAALALAHSVEGRTFELNSS